MRILEAAMAIVQAQGRGRSTLREVCQRAGCSPSMIHYHFGDKTGLFRAAQECCFEPLLQEIGKQTGQARNSAMYVRFWDLYRQVRRLARTSPGAFRLKPEPLPDALGRHPYGWECRKRVARTVGELLDQGMAAGDLRPGLDREVVVEWFLLFCLGADQDPKTGLGVESLARFDLFWRGIAQPRSARCRPTPWGNGARRFA